MSRTTDNLLVVCIIIVATLVSAWTFDSASAGDFQALWLAGEFYHLGQYDQIYPPETEYFTTRPSPEWIARVAAQGQETAIYSYIYPPLWAALLAPLTTITTFGTLSEIFGYINPVLIGGMFFLAWRIGVRAGMRGLQAWVYVAIGYAICLTTTVGIIGLAENQMQILVSFLILLALEREQANAPVAAGIAMGLAAALKLYPVFLVLFWLAQGKWRVTAIATAFGCALGLLSILLTGWELHAIFLEKLAMISDTLLMNPLNFALEVGLANICCLDQMNFVLSSGADLTANNFGGLLAMAKPPLWAGLSKLLIIGTLAALAYLAYQTRRSNSIAFWPFALGAIVLTSPLGWSYQFLTAVSFAPALPAFLGMRIGFRYVAVVFIPLLLGLVPLWNWLTTGTNLIQFAGMTCFLLYTATWAIILWRNLPPTALVSPSNQKQPA